MIKRWAAVGILINLGIACLCLSEKVAAVFLSKVSAQGSLTTITWQATPSPPLTATTFTIGQETVPIAETVINGQFAQQLQSWTTHGVVVAENSGIRIGASSGPALPASENFIAQQLSGHAQSLLLHYRLSTTQLPSGTDPAMMVYVNQHLVLQLWLSAIFPPTPEVDDFTPQSSDWRTAVINLTPYASEPTLTLRIYAGNDTLPPDPDYPQNTWVDIDQVSTNVAAMTTSSSLTTHHDSTHTISFQINGEAPQETDSVALNCQKPQPQIAVATDKTVVGTQTTTFPIFCFNQDTSSLPQPTVVQQDASTSVVRWQVPASTVEGAFWPGRYEVRWSSEPITSENWSSATLLVPRVEDKLPGDGYRVPRPSGELEQYLFDQATFPTHGYIAVGRLGHQGEKTLSPSTKISN